MKPFLFALAMLIVFNSNAQIEYGLKAGISSLDLVTNSISAVDDNKKIELSFADSKYGYHVGLYSRIKVLGIYIEPNVLLNSNKVSYTLDELWEGGAISSIKTETYTNLDLPINIGIKAGVVRIYAGPVAHLHLSSTSDLFAIKNYNQKFKQAQYGYQAGFGLTLWKLGFDVAYEANFSKFGNHINIGGQQYNFDARAARVLGTVSYEF